MSLDTSKSNLTEISTCADTLQVRNYLPSPDTNKHQTDINKKTAPKLSSPMPSPPPPHPNHHQYRRKKVMNYRQI